MVELIILEIKIFLFFWKYKNIVFVMVWFLIKLLLGNIVDILVEKKRRNFIVFF